MAAPALNLLALEDSEFLPAGCELAIRATALCPVTADTAHALPVQVLGSRHLVGGILYRARLLEAVSLPLESQRTSAGTELRARMCARARTDRELEFFIPDAQGGSALYVGEQVHLGVAAERCFLFSDGKRFYL